MSRQPKQSRRGLMRLRKPNKNHPSNQEQQEEQDHHQNNNRRKETPISVLLSLDKKTCEAGGRIEGTISMFVPHSATGSEDFSGVRLLLEGYETIKVLSEISPTTSTWKRSRKSIFQLNTEVAPLSAPLVAGRFEYPFSWQLPPDKTLPITMTCSSAEGSECQVQYNLTAYLFPKTNASSSHEAVPSTRSIRITGSGKNIIDTNRDDDTDYYCDNLTTVAEPKKLKIKSMFRNKGYVDLGIVTNTKVSSSYPNIAVTITGRGNHSSVPIKALVVQWLETVQWGARCEPERERCRIMAETTISVADFPEWYPRNKQEDAEESHQNNGIITNLPFDESARDSYHGRFINVEHSIRVTAITRGQLVTNPSFTTMIEVHRHQLKQQQPENNEASTTTTPIMAQAELSAGDSNDDTDGSSRDHYHNQFGILRDIEIPQAVPINIDSNDNGFGCPMVIEGETEHQQERSSCCSTESTIVHSASSSCRSMLQQQQQILEPVLVMAVVE